MSRFMRWGKIPFVPLVFIVEIVMKVSNNEAVFSEKNTYKKNIEINQQIICIT